MTNTERLASDRFDPMAIQLGYVLDSYVWYLTSVFGSYSGWARRTGKPLDGLFLSNNEIAELLLYNPLAPGERARAVLFWACVDVPTWSSKTFTDQVGRVRHTTTYDRHVVGWHCLAVQELYEHPEYW